MFYAGIDIAKYNHEASVIDADGKAPLDSIILYQYSKWLRKIACTFRKVENF